MTRRVREPNDLVFNRGTVPRSAPCNLAPVQSAALKIPRDDLLQPITRVRDPARPLVRNIFSRISRESVGYVIPVLTLRLVELYRTTIDPGRRPRLEARNLEPQMLQPLSQLDRRCLTRSSGFHTGLPPHMNPATQERPRSDDDAGTHEFETPACSYPDDSTRLRQEDLQPSPGKDPASTGRRVLDGQRPGTSLDRTAHVDPKPPAPWSGSASETGSVTHPLPAP